MQILNGIVQGTLRVLNKLIVKDIKASGDVETSGLKLVNNGVTSSFKSETGDYLHLRSTKNIYMETNLESCGDIFPYYNNTYNMGKSDKKWANIYATTLHGNLSWDEIIGKPDTFTPSSHTHDYLPLSGGTLSGELIPAGGVKYIGKNGYIAFPNDGYYSYEDSITGFLKITLPQSWTTTMLKFTIRIFNYLNNTSVDYVVSGYTFPGSSGNPDPKWINCTALCIGRSDSHLSNLPVRFYHDGTKCCIAIGNSNTEWKYPKVIITDIITGFSTKWTFDNWKSGWGITLNTAALTNVSSTIENTHVGYGSTAASATSVTGNLTDIAALSGFGNGSKKLVAWGSLTSGNGYSAVFSTDTPSGGGISFADKNGQTSMQIDGFFYQNEGKYKVLDSNNYSDYAAPKTNSIEYVNVYNSALSYSSSEVSAKDMANKGLFSVGMLYNSADNPNGKSAWYHCINLGWNKAATWTSQIGVSEKGMWYRNNGATSIHGVKWKKLVEDVELTTYSSYISFVIILFPLTNTDISAHVFTEGDIYLKRHNGLSGKQTKIHVNGCKVYNNGTTPSIQYSEDGCDPNGSIVTFNYGGVLYCGIFINEKGAEYNYAWFRGRSSDISLIKTIAVKNNNTGAVLDAEINNSLTSINVADSDHRTRFRQKLEAKNGIYVDTQNSGNYNEGIRVNRNATNSWAILVLGGAKGTTSGTGVGVWTIGASGTDTNKGLIIAENTNSNGIVGGLYLQGNNSSIIRWKGNDIHHDGNSKKVVVQSSAPSDTTSLWVY